MMSQYDDPGFQAVTIANFPEKAIATPAQAARAILLIPCPTLILQAGFTGFGDDDSAPAFSSSQKVFCTLRKLLTT